MLVNHGKKELRAPFRAYMILGRHLVKVKRLVK